MKAARLAYLFSHPRYTARRVAYKLYEWRHPDEPWIAQGAVRFCEHNLDRSMSAIEMGSGRSTAWFAARVGQLTSIEHDARWYETVRARIAHLPNVNYRQIPLDHPAEEGTRPHYDPLPRYVRVFSEFPDGALDLVVIDGHYRQACVLAALPKLRSGGLLLVDNTDRLPLPEWGVPSAWRVAHQSENVMGQTTIWRKV
jgi:hypothetical protein